MMNQQIPHPNYDPNQLLDAVKARLCIETDRQLSRELNISYKLLEKIRSGALAISPSMLIWMAECAHTSIEELRGVLGERRARARLNFVKTA